VPAPPSGNHHLEATTRVDQGGTLLQTSWTLVHQAALGAGDADLEQVAAARLERTSIARSPGSLMTHLKVAAPQALLVAG
jgi:hypothetical protein